MRLRLRHRFEYFTTQVAVEFLEKDAVARYGVVELSGDTVVDLEERLVKVAKPKVEREPPEIPLDIVLFYLADDVIETPPRAAAEPRLIRDVKRSNGRAAVCDASHGPCRGGADSR